MEWKYVKPLKDNSVFENIEKIYNVEIPIYLKELITKYNGGRPEKSIFDTKKSKERVLQGLISFNKEDKANIFIYEELLKKGYIPFAITEFGDLVCINNKNKNVELYLNENETIESICDSIEVFDHKLYFL